MERIIKKDGYVYSVDNWWQKGFEIYRYLGKDPDDPRWFEELKPVEKEEVKPKRIKKNKVEE